MIKDNQQYFNRLHVLIDALITACSYVMAWFIQIKIITGDEIGVLPMEVYMLVLLPLVPGMLLLNSAFNLYTPKRVQGRRLELGNILKANLFGMLIFMAAVTLVKQHEFSRQLIFIFFGLNIVFETLERIIIRGTLRNIRRRGMNLKHILLVGLGASAKGYIDRIMENPEWGYHVLGILDDNMERSASYRGIQIIELEDAYQLCTKNEMYEYLIRVAKQPKKLTLSDVVMETLSIIAYKQPITRLEIEKIRGVKCDHAINKLIEYNLVQELGRLDAPGRPLVFGTTEEFLRHFGVHSLDDLPELNPVQIEDFKAEAEEEVQMKLDI